MKPFKNKPLRLIHCTNELGSGGGVATITESFYRHLDRDLFDPVFLGTSDLPPSQIPYKKDVPYIFTSQEDRFDTLVEYFRDADIVQFFGGFDPTVCEAARLTQVPVLVELHHNPEDCQFYENIDATVCVSKFLQQSLDESKKTRLIHNGIDLSQFSYSPCPNSNRIVFLESSRAEKAMHFHLDELAEDLLALDPRIEIWMCGGGHDRPSTGRVKYLGFREDVDAIYREADFLLNLSIKETFGLSVVEAMASGCLPIVSDGSGPAEIVDHENDGWVVDGRDRNQVLETVRNALALYNAGHLENMRKRARASVEQKFNIQRCMGEHQKLYLELIRQKGRRTSRFEGVVEPTCNVMAGLLYFRLISKVNEKINEALINLLSHPGLLTNHTMANLLSRIALEMLEKDLADPALGLYTLILKSGYNQDQFIDKWLKIFPEPEKQALLFEELINALPNHQYILYRFIDWAKKRNDIDLMQSLVERFLAYHPGHPGMKTVHQSLLQVRDKYGLSPLPALI